MTDGELRRRLDHIELMVTMTAGAVAGLTVAAILLFVWA